MFLLAFKPFAGPPAVTFVALAAVAELAALRAAISSGDSGATISGFSVFASTAQCELGNFFSSKSRHLVAAASPSDVCICQKTCDM